ncbi:MAG: peptidase dimerization domain-containing protein [Pirellulales bacterium]
MDQRQTGDPPSRPDAVIVAEPTNLNIVVAHRGVIRWKIRTGGRAAHSSMPEQGDNAVYRMAPVLLALKRYQKDVVPTLGTHPLCGGPTLSVGTIHGGISVNTVPDECVIEVDRRLLPGDDAQAAYEQAVRWVNDQAYDPGPITHELPYMQSRGLSDKINGPLARRWPTSSIASAAPAPKSTASATGPTRPPTDTWSPAWSSVPARSTKPIRSTNGFRWTNYTPPARSCNASRWSSTQARHEAR